MVRRFKSDMSSGYTILLVDDQQDYLDATQPLLERQGHEVLCATDGQRALELVQQQKVDLMLLDFYMPAMTGEQVVTELRRFNPYIQVILQTGYASEQPARDLLRRLDIQGYYDKSEGPEKLLLWTDVGLKAAYTVQLLNKSRQGLRYILDVTPDLHRIQPIEQLLKGILLQICGLLSVVDSFVALFPAKRAEPKKSEETPGFVAVVEGDTELAIRVGTGRFTSASKVHECLPESVIQLIRCSLEKGEIVAVPEMTIVPLRVGEFMCGVVFLDRQAVKEQDVELLHLFANQVAVAIQNIRLYEAATVDPLTGVYMRRFLEQLLLAELRKTFRIKQPLAMLMVDMDGFKSINDTFGHLIGDKALASVGKALGKTVRGGDIVGRYGGDEFVIILPQTGADGAEVAARRFADSMARIEIATPSGTLPMRCSLGLAVLDPHSFSSDSIYQPVSQRYFEQMSRLLMQRADEALYEAKRSGGNRIHRGTAVAWQPLNPTPGNEEVLKDTLIPSHRDR